MLIQITKELIKTMALYPFGKDKDSAPRNIHSQFKTIQLEETII